MNTQNPSAVTVTDAAGNVTVYSSSAEFRRARLRARRAAAKGATA